MKQSEINISVTTDDKNFTKEITWMAVDAGMPIARKASAMLLGFWDEEEKAGMTLDLWTDKMLVDDMKILIHHTLMRLADLARTATADQDSANQLASFASEYAEKNSLFKPKE